MKLSRIKNFKIILVFLIVIVAMAAMNFTGLGFPAKNFAYSVSQPLQKFAWRMGAQVSGAFRNISGMRVAFKENQDLKIKIDQLTAENSQLNDLKKENESLKEVLNLGLDKEYDLKMAEVLGKDVSQDILTINKGADDMIEEGFPVITANKVVVGRISKTYKNFSKVSLVTSKEISFDVGVSESDIECLAKGLSGKSMMLDLIPKDKEVKRDAIITTNSLGGIFPKGLLVGTVDEVDKNDVESFQTAKITPAFEMDKIEEVFVIIGYKFQEGISAEKTVN